MLLTSLSLATTLILLHPAFTHSFCTNFTQSGAYFTRTSASQFQNVSAGYVCESSSAQSFEAGRYGSCTTYNSATNSTDTGCRINGSGSVNATGFTNLTDAPQVSDADVAALFTLVANQASSLVDLEDRNFRFAQSAEGCLNPEALTQCIFPGQAGYMQYMPVFFCVNGTLTGCSDDDGVDDGTAVMVCSADVLTYYSPYASDHGTMQYPAFDGGEFVYTTAEEARNVSADPSSNATCTSYYYDSGAFGAVGLNWVVLSSFAFVTIGFLVT